MIYPYGLQRTLRACLRLSLNVFESRSNINSVLTLLHADVRSQRRLQSAIQTTAQVNETYVSKTEMLQRHTKATCSRLREQGRGKPMWSYVYISHERQYVFCRVDKVAGTSWKIAMLRLAGDTVDGNDKKYTTAYVDRYIKRGIHYSAAERQYFMSKYYKFMFVREPLGRLVSAYRDKCLHDPIYRPWLSRVDGRRRRRRNRRRRGNKTVAFRSQVSE